MTGGPSSFDVTDFVQSLQAQLDRAQDALAIKARTGRPLTWALKDIAIDLKVFAEVDNAGNMRMRSAGPNEQGPSSFQFSFTTITRSMVEENTIDLGLDEDPRPLDDIELAGQLDPQTRQQLARVGVRTVGQLKRLDREGDLQAIQAAAGTPMDRLRAALVASSRPVVTGHDLVPGRNGQSFLRIRGANLTDGLNAEVHLEGEPVEVIQSSPRELLVRPLEHHERGKVEVFVNGDRAAGYFELPRRPGAGDGEEGPDETGWGDEGEQS